jgi:tetratricopeptide (TPR) repeat protein
MRMYPVQRTLKFGTLLVAGLSLFAGFVPKTVALGQSSEGAFARAVKLQQSGDLEAAIRAYREFLEVHPQSVEALSNLGAVYARLGRYAEAVEEYKRALELDTHNIPIRFNLALAYYKSAELPEAASQLNTVVTAQPENKNATLLLADCYLQMAENKKVIDLLSPLQATYGSDRAFIYLLGTALIRERKPEGQVLVDKILRHGESAEAHLMLGTTELMANDDARALEEFTRAIELNPTLPSLHAFYGRALLDTGNRPRAMEAFRRELELNPNDFDSNLYLGVILKQDEKFDEALRYLRRALEIRPQALDARYQIGSLYVSIGNFAEAQRILEELVKEAPEFVEAHVSLATIYYRLKRKSDGDHERAIIQKLTAQAQANVTNATAGRERAASQVVSEGSETSKSAEATPPPKSPRGARTGGSAPALSSSQALKELASSSAAPEGGSLSKPTFEELASRATAAREADRVQEAIDRYHRALKLRDSWSEGWWYLGTLYYGADRYQEARDAFARLMTLQPKGGAGVAMLGLCEFQLRQYDAALEHLQDARLLGLPVNDELTRVARYHLALLLTRSGQPEAALQLLYALAREQSDSPQILEALGLAGLSFPYLPAELPPHERELVLQAGRAEYNIGLRRMTEGRTECEKLVTHYPTTPNVHYLYGVFLLMENPDAAMGEFRRELKISPTHVRARLQIAFECLKRDDFKTGLPFAEQAEQLAPGSFPAREALGRMLLGLGETQRAIQELEMGVKLAPDSPEAAFALARAYTHAGRKEDAARVRAEFKRLESMRHALAEGKQSVPVTEDAGPKPPG